MNSQNSTLLSNSGGIEFIRESSIQKIQNDWGDQDPQPDFFENSKKMEDHFGFSNCQSEKPLKDLKLHSNSTFEHQIDPRSKITGNSGKGEPPRGTFPF